MANNEEKSRCIAPYTEFMRDARSAIAPGRVEFLGNHLDYNGGKVLGAAIDGIVCALARPREKRTIRLFSETFEDAVVLASLDDLSQREGRESWANYPLGILWTLKEEGLSPPAGFELILTTDLPISAGLSSSAAVELATALALLQLGGHTLEKVELARLCRRAENEFVGLPCGILDQGVSAFGEKDHLVLIDCSRETFATLPLPSDTCLWVFNTGIKHDLVDSLYTTRYDECSQALTMLRKLHPALPCLAAANEKMLASVDLPETLSKRSRHIVEEAARVEKAVELLQEGTKAEEIGALLFTSHESSRDLFENSCPELDFLVDDLRDRPGVIGARLTGGGFGGAVLAWTDQTFTQPQADATAHSYKNNFGKRPDIRKFNASEGARITDPLARPE